MYKKHFLCNIYYFDTYLNASMSSSSVSVSFIFLAIIVKNSGKRIKPSPKVKV